LRFFHSERPQGRNFKKRKLRYYVSVTSLTTIAARKGLTLVGRKTIVTLCPDA
jgi:hypothetical protein